MKKKTREWVIALLFVTLMLSACAKPAASTVSTDSGIVIRGVTLAEDLNENYQAINPRTQFFSTDTIFVSVNVAGQPNKGILTGKFYLQEQLISEATLDLSTVSQGVIFSVGEDTYAGFSLMPSEPWPADSGYRFELFVNGAKYGEYPYSVIQ
jgi:hypothetical protein